MLGGWKLFLCIGFWALSGSAWGRESESQLSVSSTVLESSFDDVISKVKNQLLDAPKASDLYLTHWIEVYNASNPVDKIPPLTRLQNTGVSRPTNTGRDKMASRWRPNGYPLVSPQWGSSKPFSFKSAAKFRPVPPPNLDGSAFKKALKGVMIYGDLHSTVRSPEQSLVTAYWANGTGTETPPGRWNLIALEATRHMPSDKRIEIMVMLNIAIYDAGIAAWEAKYHYNYWRPQTAISEISPQDADWEPMMQPPFHPEYVSGHSAFSGAAAQILEHKLGPTQFCMTAKELGYLERCYKSFNEAAIEAGQSRIYGGIHFEFSNQAGLKLGRGVARHVISVMDDL